MFRINHNILSLNGQRNLFKTSTDLETRMERLSSGLRINKAADDAAGLTVSELMRSQIVGAGQASKNVSQALALLQVADTGLDEIGQMMLRLKELAIQSADGTLNNQNRVGISAEAAALVSEIQRISSSTAFNGISLIASAGNNGSTNFTFYVGDGSATIPNSNQELSLVLRGITMATSGLGSIGNNAANITVAFFGSQTQSTLLVSSADTAVNNIAQLRTSVGAFMNRLQRAQSNLMSIIENTQNAESTIRDADFVTEASAMTRAQILVQAGSSMLAQANLLPNHALSLLG